PMTGHTGVVRAVALTTVSDTIPLVVAGTEDGTVQMWRLDTCTAVPPPLVFPGPVRAAAYGDLIVTACGCDLAVHRRRARGSFRCVGLPRSRLSRARLRPTACVSHRTPGSVASGSPARRRPWTYRAM